MEVKIDLVPFGNRSETKQIKSMVLWNTGVITRGGQHKYVCVFYSENKIPEYCSRTNHFREDGALTLISELITSTDVFEVDELLPHIKELVVNWYKETS